MSKLLIEDKEIVTPGEILAEGMDFIPTYGTFREGENVIASRLGVVNIDGRVIKLLPLSGKYLPKRGDVIMGKVTDVLLNGLRVDINSAYPAMLSLKDGSSSFIAKGEDLTKIFNFGDYIVSQIINVTSQNLVDLTMKGPGLRRLGPGRIIRVMPNKVPRIIGKQGSMVSMIKQATNCQIIIGQNGVVWIDGAPENETLAVATIRKVEEEAHMSGLTDRIKEFLERNK